MLTPHQPLVSRRLGLSLAAGIAVSVLACACPASGQTAAPAKSAPATKATEPSPYKTPVAREKNAALEYMTIRDLFDAKFLQHTVSEQYQSEATWVPSEQFTILLEENQPLIRRLIEASRLPDCDFGIRYEDGFDTLLPHLGNMRQFARLLASDARRLAVSGRTDDAAIRLITCIRMSAHLTKDRILISSLVSIAINTLALNQAEIIAHSYGMSDSSRKQIITAARSLLTDDPFSTRACLQVEKQMALTSIKPLIEGKGDQAGRELAKHLKNWQLGDDVLKLVEPLNEEQLNEQVDLLIRYYASLNDAWVAKDAAERLKQLEDRLTTGDFGLLVKHLAPAITKCRISTDKAVKDIHDITALLEAGMTPPAPAPEPEHFDDAGE